MGPEEVSDGNLRKSALLLVLFNDANLLHESSRAHPENPARIIPAIARLPDVAARLGPELKVRQVRGEEEQKGEFPMTEVEKLLIQVHGESYWEFVKEMWHEGIKRPEMYINQDTYFMRHTYLAASEAVRTSLLATVAVLKGQCENCLALVRPPGHHCGLKTQPHGFSFFNNLAVAVHYAIQKHAQRVAIVDWDVHHGEGTQKLFYSRKDVLFVSLHRYDRGKFFPHVPDSATHHSGSGEGTGHTINVCWDLPEKQRGEEFRREETCGDEEYAHAFDAVVMPILNEYNPSLVFISCGFDSAAGDKIGGLALSAAGYAYMTRRIKELGKKMVFVLEGGYNPEVLVWGTEAVMRAAIGQDTAEIAEKVQRLLSKEYEPNEIGRKGVQEARQHLSQFWKL